MRIKNNKILLIGLNAVLISAVVAVVFYAFVPVKSSSNDKSHPSVKPVKKTQARHVEKKPVKQYSEIYARALRESLNPVTQVKKSKKKPEPVQVQVANIKLLGTVVETAREYGLFIGSDGKQKLIRSGGNIDRAKVLSVDDSTATLDYNGKEILLKVIKSPPSSAPAPPRHRPPESRRSSRDRGRRR